ncbi:MAG: hypothetical protein IJX86_10285 [Lachnospiraceae bacterium]|nr:hypothetical protein [Lachnospiraceae bacterium]
MTIDLLFNDPRLKDIDKAKLVFIQKLFFESKQKTQKELLPFFLSIAKMAKEMNIQFSEDEVNRIVEVIKESSTPEESERISLMLNKFKVLK